MNLVYRILPFLICLVGVSDGKRGFGFLKGAGLGLGIGAAAARHTSSNNDYSGRYSSPMVITRPYTEAVDYKHSTFRNGFGTGSQVGALGWELALVANSASNHSFVEYKHGRANIRSAFVFNGRAYHMSSWPYLIAKDWNRCTMPFEYLFGRNRSLDYEQRVPATAMKPKEDGDEDSNSTRSSEEFEQNFLKFLHLVQLQQLFIDMQFANGSDPTQFLWHCNRTSEGCCGIECCAVWRSPDSPVANTPGQSGGIAALIAVVAIFSACCCYGSICRRTEKNTSTGHERSVVEAAETQTRPTHIIAEWGFENGKPVVINRRYV